MLNYEGARVKLTNTQLNKLKSAAINELFLTTGQKTKINAFANNMLMDIKLSKAQLSKIM